MSKMKLFAGLPLVERKNLRPLALVLVGLLVPLFAGLSTALARSGGDISGGGSGCAKPGYQNPYFLLDFAQFPDYLLNAPTAGEPIPDSRTLQQLGFNTFDFAETKAFALLKERLKIWKIEDHGDLAARILRAQGGLNVLVTTHKVAVETPLFNDQQQFCQAGDVSTIALYFHENIAVSIPRWNQLDLNSQAGLILHETLRRIQIAQNENYTLETEKQLRNFVAHVMLFVPGEDPKFNFGVEADGIVYSYLEKLRKAGQDMRGPICNDLKKWVEQDSKLGLKLFNRAKDQDCFLHPEFTPKDFRKSEDRQTFMCKFANGLYFNRAEADIPKAIDELKTVSEMMQRAEGSLEFVKNASALYCGMPISHDWAVGNRETFARLDTILSFSIGALNTRSVKTSDIGNRALFEAYRARTLRLSNSMTYLDVVLSQHYGNADQGALLGSAMKGFDYMKSSAHAIHLASKYIEDNSFWILPWDRVKINKSIELLRDSLDSLIKDGLLL